MRPGVTKPGVTKPGVTKPGVTKPGPTKPGPTSRGGNAARRVARGRSVRPARKVRARSISARPSRRNCARPARMARARMVRVAMARAAMGRAAMRRVAMGRGGSGWTMVRAVIGAWMACRPASPRRRRLPPMRRVRARKAQGGARRVVRMTVRAAMHRDPRAHRRKRFATIAGRAPIVATIAVRLASPGVVTAPHARIATATGVVIGAVIGAHHANGRPARSRIRPSPCWRS